MANIVTHNIDAIEINMTSSKDCLRAIIHTVLFTRTLGKVAPDQETFPTLPGISIVKCNNPDIDIMVEECIEELFRSGLTLIGPDLMRGQVTLRFFKIRKKYSNFNLFKKSSKTIEKRCWEQWEIPFIVNRNEIQNDENNEKILRGCLLQVLNVANDVSHIQAMCSDNSNYAGCDFELIAVKYTKDTPNANTKHGFIENILPKSAPDSARFNL